VWHEIVASPGKTLAAPGGIDLALMNALRA
jgi:hypothetical protein